MLLNRHGIALRKAENILSCSKVRKPFINLERFNPLGFYFS